MYGRNYIYEPVYVNVPVIYNYFWVPNYRPYYSTWYWGYYPSYYTYWSPFPIFRYRHHIGLCINFNYQYNYVNYRRCEVAYNHYYGRRGDYYERTYPNRSFEYRNVGYGNRYELDQTRPRHDVAYGQSGINSPRNFDNPRGNYNDSPRNTISSPRNYSEISPRGSYSNSMPNSSAISSVYQNPRNSYSQVSTSSSANYSPRLSHIQYGNQAQSSNGFPRNGGYNASSTSEPRAMHGSNYAPRNNSGSSYGGGNSAPRNSGSGYSNAGGGGYSGGRNSGSGRR
jgi:hypothetical protein